MKTKEIIEITKLLEKYFEGNKEIDSEKILSTWHKDAKIISTEKFIGMEGWIEFEEYYKKQIDNDMNEWEIDFEIMNIDLFKNCAIARVNVKYRVKDRKFSETQFLNLLNDGKEWLIYSKIFQFY